MRKTMKYIFSFLINWRTSVVIQHSDLNSRRDKAVCGKQCKTGSAIRHLCLNRGRMTRVGSRKYLQLIFQKSTSCCVRCQALRIMVHHLTTEGHCSNRRCRILEGCCMIQSLFSLFVFILSFSSDSGIYLRVGLGLRLGWCIWQNFRSDQLQQWIISPVWTIGVKTGLGSFGQ